VDVFAKEKLIFLLRTLQRASVMSSVCVEPERGIERVARDYVQEITQELQDLWLAKGDWFSDDVLMKLEHCIYNDVFLCDGYKFVDEDIRAFITKAYQFTIDNHFRDRYDPSGRWIIHRDKMVCQIIKNAHIQSCPLGVECPNTVYHVILRTQ
jgi:hypothetical protein